METILTQDTLLAYLLWRRSEGLSTLPSFKHQLTPELSSQVENAAKDKAHLFPTLEKALKKSAPFFLVCTEPGTPSRMILETLEELLFEDSTAWYVASNSPLDFPIHCIQEKDVPILATLTNKPAPFRLSILGLGDVGGTLLMGLRLLGRDVLQEIKIFDLDEKKRRRYYLEINEVSDGTPLPPVVEASLEAVFDTDVLVFTVSVYIPPLDTTLKDVRLVQFDKNRRILLDYAKKAEAAGFKGSYFIVSDPVDLLCMNLMEEGGIESHRIRGFGLGVMEARARFIAMEKGVFTEKLRTFGPHGQGLVVINDYEAYDMPLSQELTHLTERENFRVRETGFKPYIAPALSSGAISIVKALKGEEHLSTFYNGRVFMGARSTLENGCTKVAKIPLQELPTLLKATEDLLLGFYAKKEDTE